jgi:hypothetical protein
MTEGSKYHPLFEHLLFSGQGRLSMSFSEIEAVIGASLPPSARQREEWWSNSPSGHSQARAWLRANYRTSNIKLGAETVDFSLEGWPAGYVRFNMLSRKEENRRGLGEGAQAAYLPQRDAEPGPHPLFGIWQGKVTLLPGYDYTKPAFEPDEAP